MNKFLTSLSPHGEPDWSNWFSDYLRAWGSGLKSCQGQGIFTSSSTSLLLNGWGV